MHRLLPLLKLAGGFLLGFSAIGFLFQDQLIRFYRAPAVASPARSLALQALTTPFGEVSIETKYEQGARLIEATCINCTVNSPALAAYPLTNQGARISGKYKDSRFFGRLLADQVTLPFEAFMQSGKIDVKFSLSPTPIAAIYANLRSIVPEAERARIQGEVSGSGSCTWPALTFAFQPKVNKFQVAGLFPADRYRLGAFSWYGRNARGERVVRRTGEGEPGWSSLGDIGQHLPQAVIAAEDIAFYSHPGYDIASMLQAASENKDAGAIKRGGSTLTQQLAKNLFLDGEKNYARKLRELLYAVQLENELGKRRVLELYLNVVEWGPDIVGAKEAALRYFGRTPRELLPEQAAWLASILRSPKRAWNRQYLKDKPDGKWPATIIRRMKNLNEEEKSLALSRTIVFSRP